MNKLIDWLIISDHPLAPYAFVMYVLIVVWVTLGIGLAILLMVL